MAGVLARLCSQRTYSKPLLARSLAFPADLVAAALSWSPTCMPRSLPPEGEISMTDVRVQSNSLVARMRKRKMRVRTIVLVSLLFLIGCEETNLGHQTNFAPCCYPNSCCGASLQESFDHALHDRR